MLMVPLYADQALNARSMADKGVAQVISLHSARDAWKFAIQELLVDEK